MSAFGLKIHYDDGRVVYFPQTDFENAFGISNAQYDFCFRFDDISEGLVLELRHHQPGFFEEGQSSIRGPECEPHADGYVVLADVEEIPHIVTVVYDDEVVFQRIGDHLVNLSQINQLERIYLGSDDSSSVFTTIGQLYGILDAKRRQDAEYDLLVLSEDDIYASVARDLGVPPQILDMAVEFAEREELESDDDEPYDPRDFVDLLASALGRGGAPAAPAPAPATARVDEDKPYDDEI